LDALSAGIELIAACIVVKSPEPSFATVINDLAEDIPCRKLPTKMIAIINRFIKILGNVVILK
jgi:hypothetical protein